MATSGTTAYSPTASAIITEAISMVGGLEGGTSASAEQITAAMPAFEMLVKALQAEGLQLWTIETESITPVNGTAEYTTTKKAIKITDVVFRNSDDQDTPMFALTRDEYWRLSDKTSTSSQPTQYYFNPERTSSTITVWPVPDATAATGTIEVTYQRQIEDITATTNEVDFPAEWLDAITYQLAVRLASRYGLDVNRRYILNREAAEALELAKSWDTEQESVFFTPDNRNF